MTLETPFPIQGAGITYGATTFARMLGMIGFGHGTLEGVQGIDDYRVTQRAGGANMSVDVQVGNAWVLFGDVKVLSNTAVSNSVTDAAQWLNGFSAADVTNPRIDRVIVKARDANIDLGTAFDQKLQVLTGTPTSGATLANLTGAAAVPAQGAILLANVLIPSGSSSITTANIDSDGDGWNLGVPVRPLMWPEQIKFLVSRAANQSIATSATLVGTDVSFDAESWDTDGMFTLSVPTQVKIRTPGLYQLSAVGAFAANATGVRNIGIAQEGGGIWWGSTAPAHTSLATQLNVSTPPIFLGNGASNRYVKLVVHQNSGSALNFTGWLGGVCLARG